MNHQLAQYLNNPVLNPWFGSAYYTFETTSMLQLLLRLILDMFFIVAGLWFFIQIILGGYNFITAGGDKETVQKAQRRIQQSIIGLIIVFAAFAIAWVIEQVFGFSVVTFNIPRP